MPPPRRPGPSRRARDRRALALLVAASACSYTADLSRLTSAVPDQSSVVLAADGSVLAAPRRRHPPHRRPARQDGAGAAPRGVAIEDHRFYEHPGVDVHAMLRALRTDIDKGEIAQGGSTITQQYVRNVMLDDQQTVHRKLREMALAVQLERRFTKNQILERYLNLVYFGNGSYGVQSAAERYFGEPASELTLAQARAHRRAHPGARGLQPVRRPAARARPPQRRARQDGRVRVRVEGRRRRRAKTQPLGLHPLPDDDEMRAPYFVAAGRAVRARRTSSSARRSTTRRHLLYTGGLVIHTTLDPARQQTGASALNHVLVDPAHDPSGAIVSIDPRNGHVVAYVGGRDFYGSEPYAQFDLAGQGRRQAGSAFKPFVLATALEEHVPLSRTYSAPATLDDQRRRARQPWVLHNYDGTGGGTMNLVDATVHSVNTVYAQLIEDVGPKRVVELAVAPRHQVAAHAVSLDRDRIERGDACSTWRPRTRASRPTACTPIPSS